MSWYRWRKGRFGWSCSSGPMFTKHVRDGYGDWYTVFGKLCFLLKPKS